MRFTLTSFLFLLTYIKYCFRQLMFFVLNCIFASLNYPNFTHEKCNLLIYCYILFLCHLLLSIEILVILIFFILVNFDFFLMFYLVKPLLFLKFHLMNLLQLLLHNHFQTTLITKMSM